jgi:26S proteasome regulatory subunit N7
MVEQGGDWERRNRLKVYEGTYSMIIRDFKRAANLFLDSIATFTCTELYEYNRFVWNTIIACMVSVDRKTLKEKLIQSPDILSVIHDIPCADKFLKSFYNCNYGEFFRAMVDVMGEISRDRYVCTHESFYLREIRVIAYTQFLQSYKSVTLQSMARSFGVSDRFLDDDLSQFISSKKLSCKIDRVRGIVESRVVDAKNAQYMSLLKQGDVLLNRLQKLSRVITY